MPPRRLAALFDAPSSPLAPPTGNDGSTTPAGSPHRSQSSPSRIPSSASRRIPSSPSTPSPSDRRGRTSSSPYASAWNSRQSRHSSGQHFEDFTQAGALIGRKLKLKPDGIMMLEDFSKTATAVNEIKVYAQLLKITEMQALVRPLAANFVIPKKLDNKIDMHSFRTIMSPSLGYYVKKSGADSPSGIMKTLVLDHGAQWDVTNDIVDNKEQWGIISSRIRTRLTDRRYDIKKTIVDAMWTSVKTEDGEVVVTEREDPLDIIQLCEALIAIAPDAGVQVTLPMLGRVAVLRQVLIDNNGGLKFWEKVDEQLSMLREKHSNDESRISRAIAKVLKMTVAHMAAPISPSFSKSIIIISSHAVARAALIVVTFL
ncbi:hypothetical protein B0H14DRAFT_3899924 [Mycena olivaceomarginata]|nr:hypothetical protein B0H14DRAFT_3899924 [Mycena olivaceomarginata]